MRHKSDFSTFPKLPWLESSLVALLALGCLSSPLSAQDPEVTAADPPAAEQATVNLDVTIHGNNFKQGSVVSFLVSGTSNPGGITVNSTSYKGSKRLVANIDVAEDAVVSLFDIEVRSNGRVGKGTDLFRVAEQGSLNGNEDLRVNLIFADLLGDRIRSDWLGTYVDGAEKIDAYISGSVTGAAPGELRMITNKDSGKKGGKGKFAAERWLTLDLPLFSHPDFLDCPLGHPCYIPEPVDEAPDTQEPFLAGVQFTGAIRSQSDSLSLHEVPVGATMPIAINFRYTAIDPVSGEEALFIVSFRDSTVCQGQSTGLLMTSANVQRLDANSWHIYSEADDVACIRIFPGSGDREPRALIRMPFGILVQGVE